MRLSVNSSELKPGWTSYQVEALEPQSVSHCFFKSIPPERVGLNGEYDHNGLAKRVVQEFHQRFSPQYLEQLRVTQRGAVVVLTGRIDSQTTLSQLVDIASNVMGACSVESHRVRFR
jgi:hypothetical protein